MPGTERWTTVETSRWPTDAVDFLHRCWLVRKQIAMSIAAFLIWGSSGVIAELLKEDTVIRQSITCAVGESSNCRRDAGRAAAAACRDELEAARTDDEGSPSASTFRVELRTALYETSDSTVPMRTETTTFSCEDF